MMLDGAVIGKGKGMDQPFCNTTLTGSEDEGGAPKEPAQVMVGRGMEHGVSCEIRLNTNGDDILLIRNQILTDIYAPWLSPLQDSSRFSINPDFAGRIQCFHLEESRIKLPDLDGTTQIIALARLLKSAVRGRQGDRLPCSIVISRSLPALHIGHGAEVLVIEKLQTVGR